MITFKQALKLNYGDILVDEHGKRWKVNGEVKKYKRPENAHRIRVPLKHGLYTYGALIESDFINGKCSWLTKESL